MLKDPRNLLWIVPLAALLTLPLWKPLAANFLSPVYQEDTPPVLSLGSGALNSSEMTGVQFEQSKNGTREWLLTASRLSSSEGDPDLQFEDVKAMFFNNSDKKEGTRIRSQNARYNADTKNITLKGKVVINNDEGYEMQTDSLEYLAAEKKIRTTSAVNIQGSNIEVSGKRLVYDTVTGNYSLAGKVMCRVW
jgi:LPS export ABC transporter protein LptC